MKNILSIFITLFFAGTVASAQCVSGDCQNGSGVFEYGDGSKYEGEFKDAKRHGQGTRVHADGRVYTGAWQSGRPYGEGTMTYADGREEKGYFNGKYIGENPPAITDTEGSPLEGMSSKGVEPVNEINLADLNPTDIRVWAVVVGVTDYTAMPPLQYSDDDAYQIYAFYKSPAGGALPDEQIRILINESATKSRIEQTMRETFMKADENDVILMYFSGHGLEGSFLPFDYDGKDQKLMHRDIKKIFEESPAKHKICIADACHSGSLVMSRSVSEKVSETIKSFYDAFSKSEGGTALFLSSKSKEVSLESNNLKQGVFSHFFMRGLKGEADTDKNRIVTVTELYNFVHGNVKTTTLSYQTPVLDGKYDVNMPVGVVEQQ